MSEGLHRLDVDDPEAGLMAYSVGGKITAEQGQEIFDRINAAAAANKKLRLYYELHGFPTTEPSVIVQKLKSLGAILKTIERMAIVGDQRWLPIYTTIFDPITKMKLKNFSSDEKEQALAWIRE